MTHAPLETGNCDDDKPMPEIYGTVHLSAFLGGV